MRTILILSGGTTEGLLPGDWGGDLFDYALIDAVRVLDVPAQRATVLIPWSSELAPLIAGGIADTAPDIDPETGDPARSALVPYLPPDATWRDAAGSSEQDQFFRSTQLQLDGRAQPMAFDEAIAKHPPTDLVVLTWSDAFKPFGEALRRARMVTFGSLTEPSRLAGGLNVPLSSIIDLEQRLPGTTGDVETERDGALEPYKPFGMLLQDHFDDVIPDVPPDDSDRPRRPE